MLRGGWRAWALRHFVVATAVIGLTATAAVDALHLSDGVFRSDGFSYYVYLPAVFLHGDPTLAAEADDCCGGTYPGSTAIHHWRRTSRWIDPHPIGVAILMAPFFAVAHLLTRWSNLTPDGFSLYYQVIVGLGGLAALVAGLAVLRSLLSGGYDNGVVLATLVTVTWGTNAFHYAVFDSTFSHAYSFFLIAALLWLTDRWWTNRRGRYRVGSRSSPRSSCSRATRM